ncbi:sensor histidine kinase [Olsenella sp. SW781]|uniref:sensor histidine kinase n=1 Tax=Olsenella sp. SW781 TaxID=2530046 RepID=UPI00143C5A35|nr:ATP-binding protein [Olsenella sp. SW781]NJE81261.1 sensor histidine kinase [Olsenella sp. SW781]
MSSENPDAASVDRPRLREEAPATPAPDAARRSSSIARRVAWGFWWRRLARWVVVDLLALLAVLAALWVGYARYLPERALTYYGLVPSGDTALALAWGFGPDSSGLGALALRVAPASGGEWFFPVGRDLLVLWPVGALLLAFEALSLLGIFSDIRRVRRRLKPLNALALRAEALGSKGIMDASKIESLEQAIERASVDSPQVSTGVDDLASIEVALNGLLRQMQEAKLQQIRFVSDASHELRTPIAVIQGYVNMLDRWGKDDRAVLEESIAALKAEGAHMQELVEQLLFLARGDSGRNVLERAPVNLAALSAEVADESAMIDSGHDYRLGFGREAASDARYVVIGDASMLKQSIRVMVQNAARYSPEGTAITLGVASDDGGVSYSVRDEGIGMTPEEAGHVFERFWRADAARDVSKEGTGLGLSIARWIVERHGGTIDLVSREGVGSRFTVRIPRS